MAGHRNTESQQHLRGLEDVIDAKKAENFQALAKSSIMATNVDVSSSDGWVRYKEIVKGQRAGVEARVTPAMLRQGSSPAYTFPFFQRSVGSSIARGHLLARVLGGSGAEPRNLVPLPHTGTNLPMYQDIEKRIQRHLENQEAALVSVSVEYGKGTPGSALAVLPTALIYKATDAMTGRQLLGQPAIRIPIKF